MTWDKVPGMAIQQRHANGRHSTHYLIDGARVSESAWKRKYVRALESELDAAHAKLAAIYEIL
ncbi:hypothetical protein PG2113B_0280 [Bifidobacterium pseudolongum subsp. globosum]|uniref:hypothetical protein n=1 Tax=Bifidobacterium pseudolongum TaxID=1694 RepID=UPI00102099BD|nr:hypothetical protein [Bifidobacterium pseudolongum]RYQ05357.1 hypothetical protein PG2113B_0280 [Bifidobacterium pseudolongum subsp. globosum]RYQ10817.1 hypothetical protein PG2098B_0279 [Bifidobacterium pseudolongum subsp. globosum]RYQ15150.1 hypothetical protein PG2088B_0279 [Bifidobacterium pseudolongum subsp. globosum]RYQ16797.1 hypothetical protein PG2086B_0279 [Bifidobacterium pseudolongum subsp. globosum]